MERMSSEVNPSGGLSMYFLRNSSIFDSWQSSFVENIGMDERKNIFMVFQDTIENNIKFGKPHATNEEVVKAASWKLA